MKKYVWIIGILLLCSFSCVEGVYDYNGNGILDTNETIYPLDPLSDIIEAYLVLGNNRNAKKIIEENIETHYITDMSESFAGYTDFNYNISGWDTSSAVDMNRMFFMARSFNCDISGWDISQVRNMDLMFYGTTSFYQDLRTWDVTGVSTKDMFLGSRMEHKIDWHPTGCGCGLH